MTEVTCPLCQKRISPMSMASGLCAFTIEGRMVHLACTNGLSVHEVSEKVKDGLDPAAGWSVGVPLRPLDS